MSGYNIWAQKLFRFLFLIRGIAIETGKTAKEIMKEFKISPYTLSEHLTMLQQEDDKIYVLRGFFEDPDSKKTKSKQAGIVFSKEILDETGFTPGDAFEVIVEDDKIILKKI
jgi:hypothetical protein